MPSLAQENTLDWGRRHLDRHRQQARLIQSLERNLQVKALVFESGYHPLYRGLGSNGT